MKWFGLVALIFAFPAALWLMSGKKSTSTQQQETRETIPNVSQVVAVDLNSAADQTIKKIAEIDSRILATKGELMKHETDRQKMAQELVKIQSKISEILGKGSGVMR
jgi:hypothetical protein